MHGGAHSDFYEKDDPMTRTEVHDAETDTIIPDGSQGDVQKRPQDLGALESAPVGNAGDDEKRGMKKDNEEEEEEEEASLDGATRRNSLSATPPRIDSEQSESLGGRASPKALEAGYASSQKDNEVIIVDWDGPDDPANPKKYVLILSLFDTRKRRNRA